jgi:small-conductance mechanosensitive channel
MNDDNSENVGSFFELFLDQIDAVLAVIARSVVQWQIFAFIFALILSWLLSKGIQRWWRQQSKNKDEAEETRSLERRPLLIALYHLMMPVFTLVFLYLAIWLFMRQGYPKGLLDELVALVWLWLVYRSLLTLLHARFGEAARPYQTWILTPIFIALVIFQIFSILPGSMILVDVPILFGAVSVTGRRLLTALIVLYIFGVVAWIVEQLMVQSLPELLNTERGVIESVSILTRYALLGLGILISLGMLGIDFTSLAIVAGGLSVGIGIGLQDYVANFVSGLVILFEQTIRPGDIVEVDGMVSKVEKISLRATIVRTRASEEYIIPNVNFTQQQVKNLTKSDRRVRIRIPFGVSSESDPEFVKQLTTEAGLQHPLVLADPPPQLFFLGFGESGLDFELLVSIGYPELMGRVISDLYYTLWEVFTQNNIEIPNPQRDVNLGDGWEKLNINRGR